MLSNKGVIFESREKKSGTKGGRAVISANGPPIDTFVNHAPYPSPTASDPNIFGRQKTRGQSSQRVESFDDNFQQKHKEGVEEAFKETVKEQYKNRYKFYGLLNKTSHLIHKIRNIIPLLPSEIIIDPTKLTVIHRPFFFSEYIQSIEIGNLQRVWIETVPFLATIKILDNSPKENELMVKWIWKKKAEKARRIINGLMEAKKDEIDLTSIDHTELTEKLEEIGRLQEVKTSVSGA